MSDAKIRQRVLAILDSNGLSWSDQDDGYALRFASALLLVGFTKLGKQTVITLRAPILRNFHLDSQAEAILSRLNELNCSTHFGKWMLYEDEQIIALEYDMLGDHLQEDELMTAVTMLARLADQQDDVLQRELGGERAFEQR